VAATICPRPVTLTFDLEVGVGVACDLGYPCVKFRLPRPFGFRVRADVHDIRQTDDGRRSPLNAPAPPPMGRGHNKVCKHQSTPEKSRSLAENISRQSDDELLSSRWRRWTDVEPRQRERLRRCPRDRSSTWSRLVVWTIGVWCRVFVWITMLCSYCTTSFIESHGRRLWHTPQHQHTSTNVTANSNKTPKMFDKMGTSQWSLTVSSTFTSHCGATKNPKIDKLSSLEQNYKRKCPYLVKHWTSFLHQMILARNNTQANWHLRSSSRLTTLQRRDQPMTMEQ